jgi:hypothetical protein
MSDGAAVTHMPDRSTMNQGAPPKTGKDMLDK